MVKRICPKCNMEFDRKSCYDYHLNKKFDCVIKSINTTELNGNNIENLKISKNLQELAKISKNLQELAKISKNEKITQNINENFIGSNSTSTQKSNLTKINEISFNCSYCNKNYSSKYALSRHLNDYCKAKKDIDTEKENIFKLLLEKDKQMEIEINELKKQNKILMDKIDKLIDIKDKSKITNNSNNVNSNNTNTQNNFVMVNFGKEDLSIIDNKLFIDRIIKKNTISGVKIPDEVLKIIHFNPQYPQLSNIYISDINRDKCMVWEDGKWILSNIDNIPLIMDKICLFSQEQINDLREKYPNNKPLQDRLNTVEKYNYMIDNDYLEDLKDDDINDNKLMITRCEDFQKHTYNTIKKTLYNEGKKIKKNIKQNYNNP